MEHSELLSTFKAIIGNSYSGWHDENMYAAARFLQNLSPEDRDFLANTILNKPKYWQERIAKVMHQATYNERITILTRLLHSQYLDVALIAASALEKAQAVLEEDEKKRVAEILSGLHLHPHHMGYYSQLEGFLERLERA
ncbi:hypothetical protein [Zooshikella harenae]|uniref:HEAT repeat domain-containing protein n=1 Tax=Zooshikella harenae TaxID=2827238 RepID=A0ABS5Z9M2_9GAMM|nr:hypothetical protein [Zooshikella harenae]MBU2709995.1 hypothetical protein [Zooshikella harenae]